MTMAEKSVLTLCNILMNKIDLIKHNKAKRGLSLKRFSKDLIECIKRYNKDVHELLGDACGSLYGVPFKRRRLSSMERSDQEKSSSEDTEEETSEDSRIENKDSSLSDHNPIVTRKSVVTCTENNENGVDNDNSKAMTVPTSATKRKSRRLTIFSTRGTTPNTRLATTVEGKDYCDDDESSCSCPSIVVATKDATTQANRYIGDHIPNIILLNSRLNIKQLDLLQLNPQEIEVITKHLN